MELALYRKYRPQTFGQVIGQRHITATLAQEVATDTVAHAYLFSGPRGTGKTSVARILAKAVNCSSNKAEKGGEPCDSCGACSAITAGRALDVLEIDAATHTQVDNVREVIVETAKFAPTKFAYKIFIIDEAHMLSPSAWNALLKIVEEPPSHMIFILATTEVHRVPLTILSRCQRFDFHRVTRADLIGLLGQIAKLEKIRIDPAVLETVVKLSEGCVRDAEVILGQLFALGQKHITEEIASLVLPKSTVPAVGEFLELLAKNDARGCLLRIEGLAEQGIDVQQFANDIVGVLRGILLFKITGKKESELIVGAAEAERFDRISGGFDVPRLIFCIECAQAAVREIKRATIPQLPLEIAVVEICASGSSLPLASGDSSEAKNRPPDMKSAVLPGSKTDGNARGAGKRPASGDAASLGGIKRKWREVLSRAQKENHSLPLLLAASEPVEVAGDTVHVAVPYPFHRDKLNEAKCRAALEQILAEVYATPLRVRGVLAARGAEENHAVDEILQTLGGTVVE